jgi:phenylpropionate dioxygenase-like ring-hydroxylating dioxygenase large terminal subunit
MEGNVIPVERGMETPKSYPLPAGGPEPDRFDWQQAWYPVHYTRDLDKTKPTAFTLLGMDLVIWWEQQTETWRAFEDQCPHRLVPLSEGRIAADGLLECPYHGWGFAGSGRCERLPQQPAGGAAETSRRACVRSFPAIERQGLLFVFPGDPDLATPTPVPLVEALDESPEDWVCIDTFRDLPYDALTLLENVLDPSHLPFTHHGSVGNRVNAGPVELEVQESNKWGFRGTWAEGPRRGKLGSQDTVFMAPSLMWHDLSSKQFGRTLTVVYATPIRKGECRLFARFPFKFPSRLPALLMQLTPVWYAHMGQNSILEDDQIFLHVQERCLAAHGGDAAFAQAYYLPTKADRFVFELRQWVNLYQADPFPGQPLPPRQSRTALLERRHSHTEHCRSCRSALRGIQRGRAVAATVAVSTLALSPLVSLLLPQFVALVAVSFSGLALAASGLWWLLGRWEQQLHQGRAIPARNLPESS